MINELKSLPLAYTRKKNLFAIITLLIICLVTYWPLTFHVFSLKNDALNYFLPVRYQVSQSFYNGYFPFWSPYFNLGYPLHGDMQSGVWNPVVQLFSLFGPYTLYTLQIETLLYIYLGGIGMYVLLRYFSIHPLVNLLCACAYMLCGFNNDSCQFLQWISGTAFLPFVILFYYRLLHTPSFTLAIIFSFFLWLLFATANPGEFVVTIYLLAAMLITTILTTQKNNKIQFLKKTAGLHFVSIGLFICLALPAVLSFIQYLPLTERGSGASYEDAMSNPLHPLLIIAYIAPLSVFDVSKFQITDGIERNSWFGIFTFIFFLSGFILRSSTKWVRFCKYAFIIFFIFSLGEWGLLRIIAYYTLPLMNTFRHPAMVKLFSTFFGVILAGFYLNEQVQTTTSQKKHYKIFLILIILLTGLGIVAILNSGNIFQSIRLALKTENSWQVLLKTIKDSLSFYNLLLLSLFIQIPFLTLFYRFAIKKFNLNGIVCTGIINCMVHALLFTFFTIVKKESAQTIQAIIDANSRKDYPMPSLATSLQKNSEDGMKYYDKVGPLNLYNKKIGRIDDRISPSNLLSQNKFWSDSILRTTIMQYPLVYQPDTAISVTHKLSSLIPTTKKIVFVDDSFYMALINNQLKYSVDLSLSHFTPNAFHFKYSAKNNTFLVLSQNYYPLWQAGIDGKEIPIVHVNSSFMGVAIPAGNHRLHFDLRADYIKAAFIMSITTSLLFFMYLAFSVYKRRNKAGNQAVSALLN
jgi:hypothetical protein